MINNRPENIHDHTSTRMVFLELQLHIGAIEKNSALYDEKNFDQRVEAIDFIEFQIVDRIEQILQKITLPKKLIPLLDRAEKLKSDLEEVNFSLFQRLREHILMEGTSGPAFIRLIREYVDFNLINSEHPEETGYDHLDLFVNGLLASQTLPEQTLDLEPDMVFYQKTPARIIFELVEKSHFSKEDVFVDLGSGLGQPVILVNLLAGIKVRGIEFEPAFCDYARNCAAELHLTDVSFVNADARKADYSEGTVFFMFTPFRGEILEEVLEALRKESLRRKIKLISYGPCSKEIALQSWLGAAEGEDDNIYKLQYFESLFTD